MAISPFEIAIQEEVLSDLNARLRNSRWPDQIPSTGWDYGTDTGYLKKLIAYWIDGFDWRTQEHHLNSFEHFRADIDGLGVHFIHCKGSGPSPIPLLLLHGWPSSFVQMLRLLPLLTDPESDGSSTAPSFSVVCASLPGFGFSDKPAFRGMSVARIADLFIKLMREELGYSKFAARGGDLGAGVLAQIAAKAPEALIGLHTGGTNPYIGTVPDSLTAEEAQFVAQAQAWMQNEMAYALLQSSKPQTLAHALNDSPAGLASWIIEKFRRWGDTNGDVESRFSKDWLLTNLTIYWATETIGSSMRLYYETARDPGSWATSSVPKAMLMSAKDMFPTPRAWAERSGPIARWREIERGGHFLEHEEPHLVALDMRDFFGSITAC